MLGLSLAPRRIVASVYPQVFRSFSVTSSNLKGKKQLLDAGLTPPPKNPATSYALFVADYFADHKSSLAGTDGKIKLTDVSSAVTSAWQSLSQSKKDEYAEIANKTKAEYESTYAAWYKSLSKGDILEIQDITGVTVKVPGGKRSERQKQDVEDKKKGAPERPLTPFFLFQRELRASGKQKGEDIQVVNLAKKSGASWKEMSENDKKKYVDQAEKMKEVYKAWKDQNDSA